ncbi:polyribonucleotide nucleotidyltransferase [Neomegalonema sp.]|uniref:polyribonucleotide nucleotidyltransferase n=1 Tax=Neomegalonema sp. TaxID=2039713 RepID=UPI0026300BBC|nr:polyribonucleotide nucleotidyltransferase [Neomegalonema sp.]MDD2867190.1 polyribonucleotide nucleotidyltransferase [Neomegalonema sp.]
MFDVVRKELNWGGVRLVLETGRMARQADGAVLVTFGETTVLCTAVFNKSVKPGVDFFPLTVNYQEKYYAAGKIPGGFFKREAKPSEKETLVSRLIDRPIRPLFAEGFYNETQVVATVLSHDLENDPDVAALIGASAALTLSGAPFLGPIAGARVGFIDGKFKLNPTVAELKDSRLDLVVAGTENAVMMVESEAHELSEEDMLGAVVFGHEQMQPVIDLIIDLAEDAAKEPFEFAAADKSGLIARAKSLVGADLAAAFSTVVKQDRRNQIDAAQKKFLANLTEEEAADSLAVKGAFKQVESDVVRGRILDEGRRIDGRDLVTVRPIVAEAGPLPRTHGSALFTRGETQALAVVTLGTGDDEQIMDALEGEYRERFLLHYNFPPFSVGEAGRMGAPGRREIGHGKLAWRALRPMLPAPTDFPYTIRLVSEILESNGSSSMATVCGGSLAMMDAGVPLKRPVAGVAMGLVLEGERFAVLTDILGDEDHLGDMDFKVAGTELGVTSLQMDIKVAGITPAIMKQALAQARDGRLHILGEMSKALSAGRAEFSAHAPRIEVIQIPTDKIREVIGSGGKVIREIVEQSGAKIDIGDDGVVKIASANAESIQKAKDRILGIAAEPEMGKIYEGKVVKVMEFGAFVNFFGPRDGLVHVSQMTPERNAKPSDIVKEGDIVKVKLMGFDERGKVRLSMKAVDQTTGAEIAGVADDEGPAPRGERPPRREGGDRGGERRDRGGDGERRGGGSRGGHIVS